MGGKLCRWLKVQPIAPNFDFKLLSCGVHGVEVNEWSQPIVPYKGAKDALMFSRFTNDGNDGDIEIGDGYDETDGSDDSEFRASRKSVQMGQRIGDEEMKERKGCRLVIEERHKVIPFGRKIDGADQGGNWSDWWCQQYIDRKRETRKNARVLTARSGRVADYD